MKIRFINQPFISDFCRCQRWPARTRARALRPPDWLCYAAAVTRKAGHDARVYDFIANNWDKDKLKELIKAEKPDFVVLDSTTPSVYSDINCAQICKEAYPGIRVIMVGTHATALPKETLDLAGNAVDVIALGEYDYTINDIVNNGNDLNSVKGICFKEKGGIHLTGARPLIADLDSLPFPAWQDLNIMKYFDAGRLYPYIDIIGGRGCPYRCTFCQWPQLMFGRSYRFRSAGNIVDEIEYDLRLFPRLKYGEFFFEDDTFTANKERAYAICREIAKRKLKINWSINARPDICDLDLFKEMKKLGCREFLVGFESGDQQVLDNVKKGIVLEDAVKFVSAAKKARIDIHGCFVLGLPGETSTTARRTIDFALSLGVDTLQFSAAVPLPGSEYFDYCSSQGLLKTKSWDAWLKGGEQGAIVDYPGLSIQQINRLVDDGLKKFYFRFKFIFKFVFNNKNIFDIYRKFKGAFNFLSYLVSNK